MNGRIDLFTHYNPHQTFKTWLENELEVNNNDPILFIYNMSKFYLTLKETEHKTPFIETMIGLLKEWFDNQLIRPMSIDYSVQVNPNDSVTLIQLHELPLDDAV